MAACAKALGICEILEHIISFLPPHKILTVERVSKAWKALIDNSKKITHARCLVPSDANAWSRDHKTPFYAAGEELHFHPRLGQTNAGHIHGRTKTALQRHTFQISTYCLGKLTDNDASTYLSSPPITSLRISMRFGNATDDLNDRRLDSPKDEVLTSVDGLRFGHLMEAASHAHENSGEWSEWGSLALVVCSCWREELDTCRS